MTQMATGARTFLRGDVRAARTTATRSYTREQAFESRRFARTEQPYFTPRFPLALSLTHAVRIGWLDDAPTQAFAPLDTTAIVSDTRELAWRVSPERKRVASQETEWVLMIGAPATTWYVVSIVRR